MTVLEIALEIANDILAVKQGDNRSGALFSSHDVETARCRFLLWRVWDDNLAPLVWWMLNPSKATHVDDDATVRRCIGWAHRWGYGGIIVLNAYAFRATDPSDMLRAPDRVGMGNDAAIAAVLEHVRDWRTPQPQRVMVAWGDGIERARNYDVLKLLQRLQVCTHCLGCTKSGNPRHPVRLPYETTVEQWPCSTSSSSILAMADATKDLG